MKNGVHIFYDNVDKRNFIRKPGFSLGYRKIIWLYGRFKNQKIPKENPKKVQRYKGNKIRPIPGKLIVKGSLKQAKQPYTPFNKQSMQTTFYVFKW